MSAAKIEETREQFGERAVAVYERQVKPKLKPEDDGKFVVIDANTGEFEVDEDSVAAADRLEARLPNAEMWLERAGYPTACEHIGVRLADDKVEFESREVFERVVKPKLKPEHHGKFVAFDAKTGEHEIDDEELVAIDRLKARLPTADVWLERAGYPAPYEFVGLR